MRLLRLFSSRGTTPGSPKGSDVWSVGAYSTAILATVLGIIVLIVLRVISRSIGDDGGKVTDGD